MTFSRTENFGFTFFTTSKTLGWPASSRYAPTPRLSLLRLLHALKATFTPRIASGGASWTWGRAPTFLQDTSWRKKEKPETKYYFRQPFKNFQRQGFVLSRRSGGFRPPAPRTSTEKLLFIFRNLTEKIRKNFQKNEKKLKNRTVAVKSWKT